MKKLSKKINYYCILFEGLFNLMGYDLLGITSITPLFLSQFGASLGLIGMLTTVQGESQAVVPLLSGGFAAAARSKRKISLAFNGASRPVMLLIPLALLLRLPNPAVVGVFVGVFVLLVSAAPVTGLTWNYLLNDCVEPDARPKLLGMIFALSGVVSFGASNFIKAVRDSSALLENMKYFYIFGLAGAAMTVSVLCFLPLKENKRPEIGSIPFSVRDYLGSLTSCFHNRDFTRLASANVFSYVSSVLNAFIYIYASQSLRLQTNLVSNMIIFQTIGLIAGGVATGQVSSRFGVKRMLVLLECAGLLIPAAELLCARLEAPYPAMCLCVFLFGFVRSGQLGYTNYIIEVVEKDRLIFHMVAKGLVLLPVSFLSTLAGFYIQSHAMTPVFLLQAAASCAAIFLCTRLRLVDRGSI